MTVRVASCHCGALEVSCDGGPTRVSMCHCIQCQRRTGSAFSVAVFYARAAVRVTGETRTFSRDSDSGFPVTFHFCPSCGSNVFWEPARLPERIGVALGAFADPDLPPPEQSVWTKDKHRWIALPADLTAYDAAPPQRG
jgi:hypothetical protein